MQEVRDPRLADLTVTGVEVTPDLLQARVYFTVLGDNDAEREALAALEHATGYLRTQLAARVQLRFVPELTFQLDTSMAYGRRIDDLLDQITQSAEEQGEPGVD